MADLTADLEAYLIGVAGISAKIGAGTAARMFHHVAKEAVSLPFAVIEEQGGVIPETLGGTGDIARGDYVVVAYDDAIADVTALWEAIRINLQSFGPAAMNSGTWVHSVNVDTGYRDRGSFVQQDGSQRVIYFAASRFSIWHNVTAVVN
jgi:hypothetical protein